jgi:DNA-binding response OmpR family regulator
MMGTGPRTLVVDDEATIRTLLCEILEKEGHQVETAASGEDALEYLRDTFYHLAILDLNLGGRIDGLRVLSAIRWRWPNTAAIILTAHGSLDSAMEAIREGVDGYLLKPVRVADLRQAVKQALEQRLQSLPPQEEGGDLLQAGDLSVDLKKRNLKVKGQLVELNSYEYALLVHLMENEGRVVPPQELVEVARGYRTDSLSEARDLLRWYIYRLRRKVEADSSHPRYIVNVRGVGYTFKG